MLAQPAGILLSFELQGNQVQVVGATAVTTVQPRRASAAADEWTIELLDTCAQPLWHQGISDPGRFSPRLTSGQPLPFAEVVPLLGGAATLVLRDGSGRLRLSRPMDQALVARAVVSREELARRVKASKQELAQAGPARMADRHPAAGSLVPEELVQSLTALVVEETESRQSLERHLLPAHARGTDPRRALIRQLTSDQRSQAVREAVIAAGDTELRGRALDDSDGSPIAGAVLDIWQYDASWRYVGQLPTQTADTSGVFTAWVDTGNVVVRMRNLVGSRAFVTELAFAEVTGPASITVFAYPAVTLSGRVRDRAGHPVPRTTVEAAWRGYVGQGTAGQDGRYSLLAPRGRALTVDLVPPIPFARPMTEEGLLVSEDTTRDFTVDPGVLVSGTIETSERRTPLRISVVLRHVSPSSFKGLEGTQTVTLEGPGEYAFAVPTWLSPRTFLLSVAAEGHARFTAVVDAGQDTRQDVVLVPGVTLSGTVHDVDGHALKDIRVRAWQGRELAASYLSESDGHYSLSLVPATYTLRAAQECPGGGCTHTLESVEIPDLEVSGPSSRDLTLPTAAGALTLRVALAGAGASEISQIPFRVEVRRLGELLHAGYYRSYSWFSTTSQRHVVEAVLALPPDRYSLTVHVLGHDPVKLDDVDVGAATSRTIDLPAPHQWAGTMRLADGSVVPGATIRCQDDLTYQSVWMTTDGAGRFEIPITPDGLTKFYTPESGSSILRVERHLADTLDRTDDLELDALQTLPDTAGMLTQIYGVEDRSSRFNIVFIGESYTTLRETFTDSNHSGTWDGVLFGDTNQNGRLDQGEPYTRYGNAPTPVLGTDPTRSNEHFVDSNGDGFPNLDDQVILYRNAVDTLRSLFGQDLWSSSRNVFNAFLVRVVSRQAGNDVIDASGNVLQTRDTFFEARVTLQRNLLEANYDRIQQVVHELVPEADIIIALVNQPVRMGRANSFILTAGGPAVALANSYVIAHEMGHNLGRLRDEYTEFPDAYLEGEPTGPNITTATSLEQIPWRELVAPDREIPSVAWSSGAGLYEGAYYHTAGAFRPTQYCMMVSGDRFCPVCTHEVMLRLAAVTGGPTTAPTALEPIGSSALLRPRLRWTAVPGAASTVVELRRAADHDLVAYVDVFDTSFVPDSDLAPATRYAWRVAGRVETKQGPWSAWLEFETAPPSGSYPRRHLHPR